MKRLFVILSIALLCATASEAFLYEITLLTQEQIKELTNEELFDVYVEAKIEELASHEFHQGAGFSNAKEYNKRKDLLRYIIDLRREMSERELEVFPIEEWLN